MNTSTSVPPSPKRRPSRRHVLDAASLLALGAALLLIFSLAFVEEPGSQVPRPVHANALIAEATTPTATPLPTSQPTVTLVPTVTNTPTPEPTPTPSVPVVALIAGHRNNDSGAICEAGPYAGLQEVHVTTEVAALVVNLLRAKGYTVIDLDEFDPRLTDLRADVMLSIHVDSCVEWEGTSGYKVARASNSHIPEIEDRLVTCLIDEYGRATGLPRHDNSVTHNMTLYHAFRKIDLNTPAAIIELGFLYHDHDLLTEREEVIAEGLTRGLTCFLKEQGRVP